MNPVLSWNHHPNTAKRLRDFFMKNAMMKDFMAGMDKKDERFIMTEVRCQNMTAGDRIVKHGAKDRAIYIVICGSAFGLPGTYPATKKIYNTGSVIGSR